MRLAAALLLLTSSLQLGCAYPRTIRVYDEECQITARKMVLDVTAVKRSSKCVNNDCLEQLLGEVTLLAASTVVSGSIVVAGNVVYWLEKRANCNPVRTLPAPAQALVPA